MKRPFVTKEQIEAITRDVPTPFHIYDEKGIRENAAAVQEAFSWNKGFREYFAVKAEPNLVILKILRECGCGSDCASLTELILAKTVGNTGDMVMFSSNDTPDDEYAYAAQMDAIVNLDDLTMVECFERAVGTFPKTMSCRFNPGGVYQLSNGIMDNPGDSKFGMTEEQLKEAFRRLKAKGVEHFGIHAFLVSNTITNDYYPELARTLFELAVRVRDEVGCHIAFINLSGGVGIPYRPEDPANDIRVIGEGVRRAYEEILTPAGMDDVAIYTEMGRFMTGPYGALITTAIHEKRIMKHYIGVDASAVNLMRPAMYGAYHHITVLGKEELPATEMYDVTGSLCENNDKFAVDRYLPEVEMGDILCIHDTGAHGFSMGYNYNGKLKSAEVLLKEDGSYEIIRRAETPVDYFATFDGLPVYEELMKNVPQVK